MGGAGDAQQWRGLVSALLGENSRLALARIILGEAATEAVPGLSAKQARAALAKLAPYTQVAEDGSLSLHDDALARLLRAGAGSGAGERTLATQFLDAEGRLLVYPSKPAQRAELLEYLAARHFVAGEELSETQVNERLRAVTGDFATLRRYLVDHGLLSRVNNGSGYRLEPGGASMPDLG